MAHRSRHSGHYHWFFEFLGAVGQGSQSSTVLWVDTRAKPGLPTYLRSRLRINLPHGFAGHAAADASCTRAKIRGWAIRERIVLLRQRCCGLGAEGCCCQTFERGSRLAAVLKPMGRRRGCKAGSAIFGASRSYHGPQHDTR